VSWLAVESSAPSPRDETLERVGHVSHPLPRA